MESITHRELRNSSAEILRRVEAGESFTVTNHGRPVAVISPPPRDVLAELIENGVARPASAAPSSLADLEPVELEATTVEILDDLRGRW